MAARSSGKIRFMTAKAPLVSVVIPVHNRREVLRTALKSVRSQCLDNCETVVVDDASDQRLDLEGLDVPQLRVVRHEFNKGAAEARNTGVREARGEFIAFLDSDDCWEAGKIAAQVDCLVAAGENVAGVFSPFASADAPGRVFNKTLTPGDRGWFDYFLMGCRVAPGSTMMVRKKAFEEIGPQDSRLVRYEDWDWLLRVSRRYDFASVDCGRTILGHSGRPSADIVMTSIEQIEQRWLPSLEPAQVGRFRAALEVERAAAARWSGNLPKAMFKMFRAAGHDPAVVFENLRWRFG